MNQFTYTVLLVLLFDKTGSMKPIIEDVKKHAIELLEKIMAKIKEKGKKIDSFKVKVIGFGDFYVD